MSKTGPTLTMQQMAEELNLSRRVISAVVNGRCDKVRVSPATERRVREYLEASGYVRSRSALQLKHGGKSDQIGIFYCGKFVALEYLTTALTILTEEIRNRCGFFEISGVNPDHLYEGVSEIIAKGIRKLIWIHGNTPQEEYLHAEKLFPLFRQLEKVVIFKYDFLYSELEKAYLDNGIELVGFDSVQSYHDAARLFRESGHTKVGLNDIFEADNLPLPGNDRLLEAFLAEGLEVFGLQPPEETPADRIPEEIAKTILRLYRDEGVRAVFIRNDLLIATVMHLLQESGVRIPEEIALIGFSGSTYSSLLNPPLTTFNHPIEAMCRRTMELIDSSASGKAAQRHIFANRFVLRKSHICTPTPEQGKKRL